MRIITGSAKGTVLVSPPGDSTRPTSDRTKEAVFSIIQFSIEGRRVLDLFSGSGQMALEALSRGAESATAVDSSAAAAACIRKNAAKCRLDDRLELITSSLPAAFSRLSGRRYDIIFIDPPYSAMLVPGTLREIAERDLLSLHGTVICETSDEDDVFRGSEDIKNYFKIEKQNRYGAAAVSVLRRTYVPEEQ